MNEAEILRHNVFSVPDPFSGPPFSGPDPFSGPTPFQAQQWVKALFEDAGMPPPTQAQLDSMPGILLRRLDHVGEAGGTSAFHQVLRGFLPDGSAANQTPAAILSNLSKAYTKWDPENGPTFWKVAAKWLSEQGIQVTQ